MDIGIVTIRDDEFAALLEVFPKVIGHFRGRREYTLRSTETAGGKRYTLAILKQLEQGNGEAQNAARDLIDDLSPSLIIVVGIGGGVPSDDYTLGDVVIATRVNDFSVEARKAGSPTTYNLSGGPIAKEIAAGIANLQGRNKELGRWTKNLPSKPNVRLNKDESFYGPKKWREEVVAKLRSHFGKKNITRDPIFISGAIATSDRLIKDVKVLIPWLQTARHTQAIDMESGGVYRAAQDRCAMLAIRGISDIVGFKRADAWTKYACASAAAFTKAYLRTEPVTPKVERPTPRVRPQGASVKDEDDRTEEIYTNLVKLDRIPEYIFVAPSLAASQKQAWAMMLENKDGPISNAWILYEKMIYSFEDPSGGSLMKIIDESALERIKTGDVFDFQDQKKRRVFVWLLNGALKDDLWPKGIRFFSKADLFAFSGFPTEPEKQYTYRNVHQQSSITVVSHNESTPNEEGKTKKTLRHTALSHHFRYIQDTWYLEITPTYLFTFDGKNKSFYHGKGLSGIKRLEKNRSVLSQTLLWSHLLCDVRKNSKLIFSRVQPFLIKANQDDDFFEDGAFEDLLTDADVTSEVEL